MEVRMRGANTFECFKGLLKPALTSFWLQEEGGSKQSIDIQSVAVIVFSELFAVAGNHRVRHDLKCYTKLMISQYDNLRYIFNITFKQYRYFNH